MNGDGEAGLDRARMCLQEAISRLTGGAAERRHEPLMEWAVLDLGLERDYAEQVYAVAEEEELEPVYALLLVRCGLGVLELEAPEPDAAENASQQAPPDWLGEETVELDDVALERRLRASFRRFRSHLAALGTASAAADAFAAEPDVAAVRMR
jgi:hypothetical protein